MPTRPAIAEAFPGAVDATRFVARTRDLLAAYGFLAHNTIACVGICRDELAHPFVADVSRTWGEAFNFSSLAGMLTLGRTGFAAARSHAPLSDGQERFLFITMPHIGVDHDGTPGRVRRRGQREPTPACGALVALAEELRSGRGAATDDIDPDDIEQSLLRRRLRPLVGGGRDAGGLDIVELTRVARRAALADLERLIAGGDMGDTDYAVFSGVQIHTPEGDLVWPAEGYLVSRGKRQGIASGP